MRSVESNVFGCRWASGRRISPAYCRLTPAPPRKRRRGWLRTPPRSPKTAYLPPIYRLRSVFLAGRRRGVLAHSHRFGGVAGLAGVAIGVRSGEGVGINLSGVAGLSRLAIALPADEPAARPYLETRPTIVTSAQCNTDFRGRGGRAPCRRGPARRRSRHRVCWWRGFRVCRRL